MSNIIDFPVQVKVKTCGDCKIYDKCYDEIVKMLGTYPGADREKLKITPACKDIKS